MNNVGALIRMLRDARGVKLHDLPTKRSAASISRFERGEIDLTYDVLPDLLTTLGVDYHDLMLQGVVGDTAKNDWTHLGDSNWDEPAVLRLQAGLQAQVVAGVCNPFLEMAIAVVAGLLELHQQHTDHLSRQVVYQVTRYFEAIDGFSRVEGIMLLAVEEYLPAKALKDIVAKRVEVIQKVPQEFRQNQVRQVISLCSGLAARAGMEDELTVMRQALDWMAWLRQGLSENPISRYNYLVTRRLYELKCADTDETRQRLVAVIKTGRIIAPPGNYEYFKAYAIREGWLNAADFQR